MEKYKYDAVLGQAIDYRTYRSIIDDLLAAGKTSGEDHSPFMISYTHKNVERMQALDNKVMLTNTLKESLHQLKAKYIFLVLTEAWCGDASQSIPVLHQIAEASEGKIELKLIWRDENPEVMARHLTNGGKSIPKLILLNKENLQELGSWGPRPDVLQELTNEWKNEPDYSLKVWAAKVHAWYNENKTIEIQKEITALLKGSVV